jgi:hypothetical protein
LPRSDPLRYPALYEVCDRLGDAQFLAYHGAEVELSEVFWRNGAELAVLVAGCPVVQFLLFLPDQLQGVRGEVAGEGELRPHEVAEGAAVESA